MDRLLAQLQPTLAAVSVERVLLGRDACRRYGLDTWHPAWLNFGDGFAYALGKAAGEPPLFEGDDFVHTDVACPIG